MAKKTPQKGSNANKKSQKKTTPDESQRSFAPGERDAVVQAEKAEKKASGKPEKSERSEKSGKSDKADKGQQKSAKGTKTAPKKDSIFKKIVNYFKNVRLEVKRTTWPSRGEVLRMSLIVIGALIFFGVFIFVIDWLMTRLLEFYATLVPAVDPSSLTPTDTGVDPGTDLGTDSGTDAGTGE